MRIIRWISTVVLAASFAVGAFMFLPAPLQDHRPVPARAFAAGAQSPADSNAAKTQQTRIDPCAHKDAPKRIENPLECLDADFRDNFNRATFSAEVYDGTPTDGHDETVMLVDPKGKQICTGVLIGQRLVATAGHCIAGDIGIAGTEVHFGPEPYPGSKHSISVIKADYDRSTNAPDIALVQLKANAKTLGRVTSVSFAIVEDIKLNSFIRVVGYGEDETGRTGQKLLAAAPIASRSCDRQLTLKPSNVPIKDSQLYGCHAGAELVAGYFAKDFVRKKGYADTCHGDSGGPAFVVAAADAASDGEISTAYDAKRYRLAAITSRAIKLDERLNVEARECGYGGVYVLMTGRARAWIEKTAKGWNEKLGAE